MCLQFKSKLKVCDKCSWKIHSLWKVSYKYKLYIQIKQKFKQINNIDLKIINSLITKNIPVTLKHCKILSHMVKNYRKDRFDFELL